MNHISQQDRDRLVVLGEECAEIIQIASKIQRFGLDSYHPADPSKTNQVLLEGEIADLLAVIGLLTKHGVVRQEQIAAGIQPKLDKLKRFGIT